MALADALSMPHAEALGATTCAHCGSALGPGAIDAYCCAGCRAVAELLRASGMERFYDLRGGAGAPVALADPARRDLGWLAPIETQRADTNGACRVALDAQGMHCAGCVWLVDRLFEQHDDAIRVISNPSLGRIELWVGPRFDLEVFVREVERFGYLLGPALKKGAPREDALLVRTGVAVALAANAMMFALAIYLGLREGPLFELMRTLEVVLAAATVAVGAPIFARGAIEGLRRRVLHLDLPIALGMFLALAGTIWAYLARPHASYGDTVAIFVALMLLGRWLQQRVVARNRDRLLESEGADGLFTRRVEDGRMAMVRCAEVRRGDVLLIAPGELVPVDARLEGAEPVRVSLDWINGESAPRSVEPGAVIAAGAFSAGTRAFRVRSESAFADSPLVSLLGRPVPEADARSASPWWDLVSRVYVVAVLVVASLSFAAWYLATGDLSRALEVTTAVLVVTCPCGIGIATPLAYELAGSGLRRLGLYVRRERLLDRVPAIRRVVFDKTGTLTTGAPELAEVAALAALSDEARDALADLVARSTHPKSLAVRSALGESVAVREDVIVEEHAGRGLEARIDGVTWRLGRAGWAGEGDGEMLLAKDGEVLATLRTREAIRPDAREEIAALAAEGHEVWILSGDEPARVRVLAAQLGIPGERAIGGCSPEGKAAWIREHDRGDTLFVGDGINDGPAAEIAFVSGTPAVDRPFLPSRADFWFTTPGLGPIRALLHVGSRMRRIARRNLVIAVAYNTIAVSLCVAGHMQPWLAAVMMPASSLVVIGATAFSLSRGAAWQSGSRASQSELRDATRTVCT
ncbi:heavy metal translocating P-type ATPase [Sandaracinus amylolyticus]|uniref:heavy metal translocating P-type ATPase n=1 Tax=Sandaracinus amylolyticus TaxID=927083 RepID=UPI001F02C7EF|nr:heavy metal translocating P-type ATPase metal-binding domain-containing protein [Sandaracinus amylolyticus]UJR79453.1 Heavy metal translocating P-type ATPase [Sandaracinus amylolyticus]